MTKKRLQEIAVSLQSVAWTEIEDDVTLCVAVRRVTDHEITLKEAAQLRVYLEEQVEEKRGSTRKRTTRQ